MRAMLLLRVDLYFKEFMIVTVDSLVSTRWCSPGVGKTLKDAASVRATHKIPAACGIYYFEVKIISKGRDGLEKAFVVFYYLFFEILTVFLDI